MCHNLNKKILRGKKFKNQRIQFGGRGGQKLDIEYKVKKFESMKSEKFKLITKIKPH